MHETRDASEIGWFGLLRHETRLGGAVLSQNIYGLRRVWRTTSDEELTEHWEQLQREYDAFMQATRMHQAPNREQDNRSDNSDNHLHLTDRTEAYERATAASNHNPEIWVGSLSDYNNGRLHGAWLDATLDPDDLHQAVQFILRTGHDLTAEEWAIMDYDDFCGLNLGEYESLEVVSRIAQGIEAYAKPHLFLTRNLF